MAPPSSRDMRIPARPRSRTVGERGAFGYAMGRCSPVFRKGMHLGEGGVRRPTGTGPLQPPPRERLVMESEETLSQTFPRAIGSGHAPVSYSSRPVHKSARHPPEHCIMSAAARRCCRRHRSHTRHLDNAYSGGTATNSCLCPRWDRPTPTR